MLCEAFPGADILLSKLNNPKLRLFLKKRTMKTVPNESTLRKNYVDNVFLKGNQAIRQIIRDNLIYFHVDETTNSCGRYVANLLIGT